MGQFKVYFKKSVEKDFKGIPKSDLQKILKKIQQLHHNPRPNGSEKLTGQERYRIRHGKYRIVYSIQDTELTVWVVKIGHRKEIYR
jgi:mRNA interferase RelE/StbE